LFLAGEFGDDGFALPTELHDLAAMAGFEPATEVTLVFTTGEQWLKLFMVLPM
jgi:hypothetical protein